MTNYLLDTNHASWLLARDEGFVARLRQSQTSGAQFGISITVLAELYYAVYASQHRNDLILLTDDHHLTFVEGIRIENWRA